GARPFRIDGQARARPLALWIGNSIKRLLEAVADRAIRHRTTPASICEPGSITLTPVSRIAARNTPYLIAANLQRGTEDDHAPNIDDRRRRGGTCRHGQLRPCADLDR